MIAAVREKTRLPLIPKLAPDIAGIRNFAKAAEETGADAISLINSVPAMAIDIEERRPILGNVTGGLSGPAIKPIALKMVWEAARTVKIPIAGIGGISCAADALEFILAGATAVAVGTANFTDPAAAPAIVEGIEAYLVRHNMSAVTGLVGSLRA